HPEHDRYPVRREGRRGLRRRDPRRSLAAAAPLWHRAVGHSGGLEAGRQADSSLRTGWSLAWHPALNVSGRMPSPTVRGHPPPADGRSDREPRPAAPAPCPAGAPDASAPDTTPSPPPPACWRPGPTTSGRVLPCP